VPNPSVLIIGAGVGGLSTGCYTQMNGLRTRILEMHSGPGGVCTAWSRQGYVFDGCIHNLAGTASDSRFHPMWRELGVIPRIRMRRFDELVSVERPDGEPFTVYTDLDRLEVHMKHLAPADAPAIERFIRAARWFAKFDLLGMALAPPAQRAMQFASALPTMVRWGGVTLEAFAKRFTDPFLRRALPMIIYDWPKVPALMALSFLGRASAGDLGWPEGGSQALSVALADRLRALGGDIRYHTKVRSILVEGGKAVGVRLEDGSEERADVIVSNASGHATIFEMLGGQFTTRAIRACYRAPDDRIEMGVHVALGVRRDLAREPHAIVLPLAEPVTIAGEVRDRLYVEPFGFDPTLGPHGGSPLKVVLATSFRRWATLAEDPVEYRAEQSRIAETIIGLLESRFPGLKDQIEATDVATPMTTLRFTGNGQPYRNPINLVVALFTGRRLSQSLPGLANFHMVGQWAGVPGVSSVAAMGRDVARQICRHLGHSFIAGAHLQSPAVPANALA
jgi:phytoene dehydrogenase-like protein